MTTQLRVPCLNERRCIIRHELGFYRGLATAAVYGTDWPQPLDRQWCLQRFGPALQQCVEQHPILGAVIDSPGSEQARFRRLPELQLKQHLHLLSPAEFNASLGQCGSKFEKQEVIRRALEHAVNISFPDVCEVPPWRVFVIPLSESDPIDGQRSQTLVLYNYSHSHGDGLSGLAFQRTLSQGLRTYSASKEALPLTALSTGDKPLPPPPEPWPISWSYLLSVLAKEFVPWLPRLLFWKQAQPGPAWTGSPVFFDKETFRAGVRLITIGNRSLQTALKRCRAHDIKLTGVLHLMIVRGLDTSLRARGIRPACFASSTPIDLRRAFGLSASDMNNGASAVSYTFPPPQYSEHLSETELRYAYELGAELARSSSTTQDQVVGLLKYAVPIEEWLKGKSGKARDTTYELSNIMSFSPEQSSHDNVSGLEKTGVEIDGICWAQPADAIGPALCVNVVSLKGGDLSIAISWQYGALGVTRPGSDVTANAEDALMNDLSSSIEDQFAKWAKGPTE